MNKYNPEQIKAMVKTARNNNDERYTRLIVTIAVTANISPDIVDQKIIRLAQ